MSVDTKGSQPRSPEETRAWMQERRRVLTLGAIAVGSTALAACGPAGEALESAQATLEAAQRNLTSGLIEPPIGMDEINDPSYTDPNQAISKMMRAYAADGGFNPGAIEGAQKTAEWWGKYGPLAKEIIYLLDAQTRGNSGYYDFSEAGEKEQMDILYDLTMATKEDPDRSLILDIGPNTTLSPIQTAAKRENTTVVAVDWREGPPPEILAESRVYKNQIPTEKAGNSFAAFFKVNAFDLDPKKIAGRFDEVHIFAPQRNMATVLTLKACGVGDKVVVIPDPKSIEPYDLFQTAMDLGATGKCTGQIVPMNIEEIEALTGAKHSAFFEGIDPRQKFDILIAEATQK